MLLGLVKPDGGQAWTLGSQVPCPDRLSPIGAIVEEPAFYPWLSGRRNLEIVGDEGAPVPAGGIDEALELAGIVTAAERRSRPTPRAAYPLPGPGLSWSGAWSAVAADAARAPLIMAVFARRVDITI
jgi:hypothetical protein